MYVSTCVVCLYCIDYLGVMGLVPAIENKYIKNYLKNKYIMVMH